MGDLLLQEHLPEIEVQPIRIPIGEWGGRVGSMMKQDIVTALTAMKGRYAQLAGLTEAEFEQMVQAVVPEWEAYRSSCTFYAVCGKRGAM